MVVATHNPSNLAMEEIEVKVPHKNFRAQIFDGKNWVDTPSSVICNEQQQELYPTETVTNCRMYIQQYIAPQ